MIKRACLAALSAAGFLMTIQPALADTDVVTFNLVPNPQTAACLVSPWASGPPTAHVTVVRGKLNDYLTIQASNIKPGLQFDMFTIQKNPFRSDGSKNPNFKDFGMAWYQSDLEADSNGKISASIRTILLDQIFGFDASVGLAPQHAFHVGFWFNNPQDAVPCGFDASKPTPFNGEHNAGPFAMISLPTSSGFGPLCTKPDTSTNPPTCHP